ncbi:MAG TPA: aldo/keto reductase [Lacunisphaera sp.]|jgi:diketogulonate reductase-like aldo/keto reductase|nr:aldo/keto reductase [Lacunisphaera sp.]
MRRPTLAGTFASVREGLGARVKLNNGVQMPWFGLGVFQVPRDSDAAAAVRAAIELGYRSIDTAALYRNERGVGEGLKSSGVPREELFVTTKVWNDDIRAGRVEAAFNHSLKLLGLDYVDLYLLHWPIRGRSVEAWRALERLLRSGRVRAIGVSNYMIPHLEELLAAAAVVPAVNQIEFHPYLQSKPLVAHCQRHGIQVEAWSPLQQAGPLLRDPVLTAIARRLQRTVAQVVLRWDVQSGIATIPKTVHPARLAENAAIFDFALTDADMAAIAALDRNERNGADPFTFNF